MVPPGISGRQVANALRSWCPRFFEEQALDPDSGSIERDDYALEIAQMDE
jgi:hypothetical protein